MGAFDRLVRAGAIAFAAAGACVPLLSEVDRPCPCVDDFICCPTTKTCRKQNECQQAPTGSDASHDARVDRGSDSSFESSRGADDRADSSPPDREDLPDVAPDAPVDRDASTDALVEPDERDVSTDVLVERDAPPEGPIVPSVECWSEPRKSNVLVLIYNPYLVGYGHSLLEETAAWVDPRFLSVRIAEYVRMASYGLVNYDVVEFRELNAWPKQMPGAAPLDEMTFFNGPPPSADGGSYTEYQGGNADHGDIFASQDLCNYLTANDVSEVWLWGGAGAYQSFGFDTSYRFAGDVLPNRAPTDADLELYARRRKNLPDCGRSVSVLPFSYPGYGYDPRIYTMRIEEILGLSLRGLTADGGGGEDIFSRFGHYALGWPDDVQVGRSDFPPNGGVGLAPELQAWNYDNLSIVQSGADDWYAYPALTGTKKPIDCTAWGCTNYGFQAWYAAHLPHGAGGSIERGCNNWWKYIADPTVGWHRAAAPTVALSMPFYRPAPPTISALRITAPARALTCSARTRPAVPVRIRPGTRVSSTKIASPVCAAATEVHRPGYACLTSSTRATARPLSTAGSVLSDRDAMPADQLLSVSVLGDVEERKAHLVGGPEAVQHGCDLAPRVVGAGYVELAVDR